MDIGRASNNPNKRRKKNNSSSAGSSGGSGNGHGGGANIFPFPPPPPNQYPGQYPYSQGIPTPGFPSQPPLMMPPMMMSPPIPSYPPMPHEKQRSSPKKKKSSSGRSTSGPSLIPPSFPMGSSAGAETSSKPTKKICQRCGSTYSKKGFCSRCGKGKNSTPPPQSQPSNEFPAAGSPMYPIPPHIWEIIKNNKPEDRDGFGPEFGLLLQATPKRPGEWVTWADVPPPPKSQGSSKKKGRTKK